MRRRRSTCTARSAGRILPLEESCAATRSIRAATIRCRRVRMMPPYNRTTSRVAMLAEIAPFQSLLNGIGWVLAWLYDVVGNFGVAIIILTILFRIVLLPI